MTIKKREFYAYVESIVGIPIGDTTEFFKGLDMVGYDCSDFMNNIANKFGTDMTNYNEAKYVTLPTASVTGSVKTAFGNLFARKKITADTFTAYHLYTTILNEKWVDPA